ncbi:hypothetical protein SKAU_G00031950 [Synaphobranchus kaupii]|uniref:BTB domain-containing protein n=1 Tax=Synaphobranchus kaupii TaxID=118154 RepID=A0A9Q1GEG6_SYNKA|nr:hypothetical protein SKAU_G00031950 [Synaphobranchus kaupii]
MGSQITDKGGLVYGVAVAWTHLRPFLPFFLISCLVVVLVHLMRVIVYSGPFTDPLFFQKFYQRWPRPRPPEDQTPQPDLNGNMTHQAAEFIFVTQRVREGEMWRYQRPGFELLLLEQLQRQQCRSEFCDTLLQSEGVCIPAHSCILSALSPQFAQTLSTAPALSPGKKHLLEFQAMGPSTLLKLVRFLYSGELQGVEERERQEVMSAACQLGIVSLSHILSPPVPQDYPPTPSPSLHLDLGDPPPALPPPVFNLPPYQPPFPAPPGPTAESVCSGTGADAGLEEGDTSEFRRFEGNIPGFINYFLNPGGSQEEELGSRRGGGCGAGAETCRRGRKQVRQKKREGVAEERAEAGLEVLRTRSGNGAWQRGWRERARGVGRGKTGRGGGLVGSRSNIRAGPGGRQQPIKIRFKRRSEMWEVVSVEEGKVATPRGGVSQGRRRAGRRPQRGSGAYGRECRGLNQDGFPIIKRQRGRPRIRPLPFPALPHHLFKALTLSPPSDRLFPSFTAGPAPDFLHTLPLPLPPAPPASQEVDESDEQIEKLLEDVMMGLNFLPSALPVVTETEGSYSNGLNHERPCQPHPERAVTMVTAAGPTVLAETVSCPCDPLEHHGNTTTIPSMHLSANPSGDAASLRVPQPIMSELNDILDRFLWTFENQTAMQSVGETAVMGHGNASNARLGLGSEPGSCLAVTSGPSAGKANPHADPNRTELPVADIPRGEVSRPPCCSPLSGPVSDSSSVCEPSLRSAGVELQNCFWTGLPEREVHLEPPCLSPEPQCATAAECTRAIPECAPTLQREGGEAVQVPPKTEQLMGQAAHKPMGFQHQSLSDSAGWSRLQPSLPLPKWLSPHPVGLQFPLSSIDRTRANVAASHSNGVQNPQCHKISRLKKWNSRCGLAQQLAGDCRPRRPYPDKRKSCKTMWVENKKRTVARRQGQERKRAEEEEEGDDDEEEGRGNSSQRIRSLKRQADSSAKAQEGAADWAARKSKAKHVKYESRSETLPGVGVADRAGGVREDQ